MAVPEQLLKAWRICRGGYDKDVLDPSQHQHADGVIDHRFVIDRQQLLGNGMGNRIQARTRTACQNDAFALLVHELSAFIVKCDSGGQSILDKRRRLWTKSTLGALSTTERSCVARWKNFPGVSSQARVEPWRNL